LIDYGQKKSPAIETGEEVNQQRFGGIADLSKEHQI